MENPRLMHMITKIFLETFSLHICLHFTFSQKNLKGGQHMEFLTYSRRLNERSSLRKPNEYMDTYFCCYRAIWFGWSREKEALPLTLHFFY